MKLKKKLMLLTSMLVVGAISSPMTFAEDNTKQENPTAQVGTVENNDGNVVNDSQSAVDNKPDTETPDNNGEVVDPTPDPEKPVEPAIKTGWDGASYYIDGEKVTDKWLEVTAKDAKDNETKTYWYFFDENGQYVTNSWKGSYYLKDNGQMASNEWIFDKDYDNWFFINEDGTYARYTWKGSYFLTQWGQMAKDGWAWSPDTGWHYFNTDGTYVQNKWIGAYYIKQWGYMASNEWIWDKDYNNWFFINEDGSYARYTWKGSYFLTQWGEMAKDGWAWSPDTGWHYFNPDGTYVQNRWVGAYYIKQWGYMAHNEWIYDNNYSNWFFIKEDGRYARNEWIGTYYVGANGAYDKNYMGTDWSVVNGTWKSRSGKEYKNVGSDLVVISIDQQKLWIVRNGDIVTNLNVVTGLQHVHDTPRGKFSIQNKQSPTVLVGAGYASPVSYWIPFIGNLYGIHDASWQPSYVFNSASSFKTMGSKGCVNVKPSQMGQVYSKTYVGMPVIIY
ncbi:Glucan-binding domain-containing protein (YG repeat) [Granulicatella balaenopterae]|uniref:Glucan-binding domain-containing protein (YG repeat) n=1 Tax=Granulicatella balaenopterae TaxID=137733 RepID=A0A1H9GTZ3_9LACT|nr:L,D-transpeptidase family protein [Granulicatella balaenopterae]SEQ53478.1 Glucan-binding domain-containing protein (YG repeat) [Granulicatella balaenopterae]